MSDLGPSGQESGEASRRLRSGDRVRLRTVDEEHRLYGLSTAVVGMVHMELAVGGFLVSFPEGFTGVFAEEELERAE